jgi:hypothetical protein
MVKYNAFYGTNEKNSAVKVLSLVQRNVLSPGEVLSNNVMSEDLSR